MNPVIQFKTTTLSPVIAYVLACFAFSPSAPAVTPAPDGGYFNLNTAEGDNALFNLTNSEGVEESVAICGIEESLAANPNLWLSTHLHSPCLFCVDAATVANPSATAMKYRRWRARTKSLDPYARIWQRHRTR